MPGFSQLKKFSDDLISLGDEYSLRASRGERVVRYEIPKTIEDKDDSEDFVLGMPEIVAEVVDTQVDDDLSDIMGISTEKTNDGEGQPETAAPSFAAPDLSNLLNPIGLSDVSSEDAMPDFSMFMEPEEPEIEEEEDIVEDIVEDMHHYYEIIVATKGSQQLTKQQIYMGPYLLQNKGEIFKKKWLWQKDIHENILKGLDETHEKYPSVKQEYDWILEVLDEN